MPNLTLHFSDILPVGTFAHLTRTALSSQRPKSLHTHDYYEIFWVQNGTVRHHLANRIDPLQEGDVVCLSPGQLHALQARGEEAIVATLCIHPDSVNSLSQQFPDLATALPPEEPAVYRRDMRQLAALNHAANTLEKSDKRALPTAAFLLPLLADLIQNQWAAQPNAPLWLQNACLAAQDPAVFSKGAAGLVAQTGMAHPHVSRTMQHLMGTTPSEFINDIRMKYAARALVTDSEPLAQIASDCGVPNLSHFHKLFRQAYGTTPRKYRQKMQRDIAQP